MHLRGGWERGRTFPCGVGGQRKGAADMVIRMILNILHDPKDLTPWEL